MMVGLYLAISYRSKKEKLKMCLSVPAKVISIKNDTAEVSAGGIILNANLSLVEDVKTGDYILLHTGFALQKIDPW